MLHYSNLHLLLLQSLHSYVILKQSFQLSKEWQKNIDIDINFWKILPFLHRFINKLDEFGKYNNGVLTFKYQETLLFNISKKTTLKVKVFGNVAKKCKLYLIILFFYTFRVCIKIPKYCVKFFAQELMRYVYLLKVYNYL